MTGVPSLVWPSIEERAPPLKPSRQDPSHPRDDHERDDVSREPFHHVALPSCVLLFPCCCGPPLRTTPPLATRLDGLDLRDRCEPTLRLPEPASQCSLSTTADHWPGTSPRACYPPGASRPHRDVAWVDVPSLREPSVSA